MMRREQFSIANIYVPVKRRATLKPEIVQEIAQSMLEVGQQVPILVRPDGDRIVLVEGLHRLEACKALGEETIYGYLTQAPKQQQEKISCEKATRPPTLPAEAGEVIEWPNWMLEDACPDVTSILS
jgi:hypothetical protein